MSALNKVYILGAGAIGLALAVHLKHHGRIVTVVRTSTTDQTPREREVVLQESQGRQLAATIEMAPFAGISRMEGLIVITAKAYANETIAAKLRPAAGSSPLVILQNGLGVEASYTDQGFSEIYRCVLYATSQKIASSAFRFRPIAPSPVGLVSGTKQQLATIVATLDTAGFPFCQHENIQREVWRKAIINSVFNSICPLMDIDNGIFHRDRRATKLALEIVRECLEVTDRLGLKLEEEQIMEQLLKISRGSDGQLISTLQDIRSGKKTEIASLNLAISRIAQQMTPPLEVPRTKMLGDLVMLKSEQNKKEAEGF